nr:hypothetical protein [uncultured archaeon]
MSNIMSEEKFFNCLSEADSEEEIEACMEKKPVSFETCSEPFYDKKDVIKERVEEVTDRYNLPEPRLSLVGSRAANRCNKKDSDIDFNIRFPIKELPEDYKDFQDLRDVEKEIREKLKREDEDEIEYRGRKLDLDFHSIYTGHGYLGD